MIDETANKVNTASSAALGEAFVAARNAKNLTQKEVSSHLRLSVKQINALESDDFASLPQPMITRGFIRNYARMLEIDADPLLENYRVHTPEVVPNALAVQTSISRAMLSKSSQPWLKYILGVIFILLLVLAWFFYAGFMPKPTNDSVEKMGETVSESAVPVVIPLPEIALPAAERMPEVIDTANTASVNEATGTAIEATLPNVVQTPQKVEVKPIDNRSTTVTTPNQVVTHTAQSTLKAGNSNAVIKNVSMSVSEQTWVRVTDKSGAIVYEKLLAANSTDGFDGLPPFNLLIGNAKGTAVTLSGKPVDLTSATKNNIARITLE